MNSLTADSGKIVLTNSDFFPKNVLHEGHASNIDDTPTLKTHEISLKKFKSNDDFGHLIHKDSLGMFFPSTLEEISQVINYAKQAKIPISCRGQGHSTYGQAQVKQGIIMDLSKFCKVNHPTKDRMTVESGARWKDVLKVSLEAGLTPLVLSDYLGLSVGGVLSVGGLGGQTHQWGTVADNVIELKVITLDGEVINCSKMHQPELFYASLTTLGQISIILEATIKLCPAPKICQCYSLYYDNLQSFIEDQTHLMQKKSCQYLEGQIINSRANPLIDSFAASDCKKEWYFMIEAVTYNENASLDLQTLHPVFVQNEKKSYTDFVHRLKPGIKFFKSNNSWYQQHPWINLLLPDGKAISVVNEIVKSLTVEDTGGWPILLYPIDKSKLSCPYFQTPKTDIIWLFAMLRHAHDAPSAEKMVESNRRLYDKALENGGSMYPVGAIPLHYSDWKKHFGDQWKCFKQLKKEHDPIRLLGLGQGIFKQTSNNI